MEAMRRHLTYANVVSTLCLFIALGGTSYAAIKVTGKAVKDGTLTGADVRDNSLKSSDISGLRAGDFSGPSRGAAGPRGATGPEGPRGAAGATNVIMRRGELYPIEAGLNSNAIVYCRAGERAIAGGAEWGAPPTPGQQSLVASTPWVTGIVGNPDGGVPTGWFVAGSNTTATQKQLRAWVVCASP
jgi:hypothetical protein